MASQAIPTGETTDEPMPKAVTRRVYDAMRSHGYDVPSVDKYEAAEYTDARTGAGLLPAFMTGSNNDLSYAVREGVIFPFSLRERMDGYFGKSQGSSNVTTLFVRENLGISDVIETLHEAGQIELAIARAESFTDHNPDEVVAYAIATFAKGWVVEKILGERERFSKGSVSQDEGGMDLYDRDAGEWVQVKCVTYYASQNTRKLEENDVSHLWYQWTCDGEIVVGENANDVNGQAANVKGVSKTLIKRCHSSYTLENGRTFRYIWW